MKKRILAILCVCFMAVSLTSCKVNWFDKQYDVPWYYIAVPVVIFSVVVFFVGAKYISSKKYVCPQCHTSFHPKLFAAMFSIHMNDDRVFKCPNCGRKGFCPPSRDSED